MRAQTQRGFVLVLTLWVLVIVALAAGYFSDRVARALELAQQSRQNTRALIDMESTRAEVLYRLGTTSMTEYGLGRGTATVYLDDRPYHGEGDTLVRLQDTRGLINLNLVDDARLNRFLGLMGIEAEKRGTLIDTLRDYTDSDKLRRLNGAEDDEYRARKLAPPANRDLITPWQARRIIGWRDTPSLWQDGRLAQLCTTSQSMGINPNTAPAEVLATLPGVTQEIAQLILTRRKLAPFTHEGQITQITSTPMDLPMGAGVIAVPSDTIRITQSMTGLPWGLQYEVKVTPTSPNAPWQTEFYGRVSLAAIRSGLSEIADLPPRAIAPPDAMPAFLRPN